MPCPRDPDHAILHGMARLPTVAIIGRPNTGKSTLFNRLVGRRQAIVSEVAGTTRDHVAARVEEEDIDYLLVDTGGIGGGSSDADLEDDVSAQTLIAMESADLILFTIVASEDLTASDWNVTEMLRKKRKRHVPVIIVATKCDRSDMLDDKLPDLHRLGVAEEIVGISAIHNVGSEDLRDAIAAQLKKLRFGKQEKAAVDENAPRIAIVGKPNVGKSSIINALMSDPQRNASPRLVSPIAGTTRDIADTVIRHEEKDYIFVDTAGLRRQTKVNEQIETVSAIKSIQALESADVVILVLSSVEPVSKQEKRLAALAVQEGKGLIILLNKSDLLPKNDKERLVEEIQKELQFARFAAFLFVSAETREGLLKMFPLLESVVRNRLRRIPTKELHNWYAQAIQNIPSQPLARVKHVTQAEDPPPTFVLFLKNPKSVRATDLKYLENTLRRTFAFEGTAIRWKTKEG